ncbi:MAG: PD-(D/E)XK nuclease family transposase [Lachnospiraceae bacterium]|nr:PD-(D/E)XK nuclease family transposase [Lachnospiraceae bacterium]
MTTTLKSYFPLLHNRNELLQQIQQTPKLHQQFNSWEEDFRNEFLDFCTGAKGVKILYDPFFKEIMNVEYAPERLEAFLSVILKRKVKIVRALPNDSTRIADETSLLVTDIIVELEDGSLANVEVQKIGYTFPAERSACYSADMLLRQYKRVRSKTGKNFSYQEIKNVYLIILYEKSPRIYKTFPYDYYHHSKQVFDTGLPLNMLQEFIMIPLDIFHKKMDNKNIETPLEAWLTFLSNDNPDKIIELITSYPEFKAMYDTLYQTCQNVERVMEMFSEELRILDQNTVKYMIEEQQQEIDDLTASNEQKTAEIKQKDAEIEQKDAEIKQKDAEIEQLRQRVAKMQQNL